MHSLSKQRLMAHPMKLSEIRMKLSQSFAVSAALAISVPAFAGQWQAREVVKPYPITGTTGPDLYAAIGESGPVLGGGRRTIAHTSWDLKWSRQYVSVGQACELQSAKPFLTITYTLPKAKAKLTGATARNWKLFSDGIAAHEKVHGRDIVVMVDEIISQTVGLRVESDEKCKLIRTEVLKRVEAANAAYKAKSRAFDTVEMSKGGAVQQLILTLVNGR